MRRSPRASTAASRDAILSAVASGGGVDLPTPMEPGPTGLDNPLPKPQSERSAEESRALSGTAAGGAASPGHEASGAPIENSGRLLLQQKRMRSVAASDRETLLRGRRAFERGDDDVALEHLSRLASQGHDYADVYYMIGILQERQGQLDLAINSLRRATRVNPGYVEALLALASLHERRGDYDISAGYAERASEGASVSGSGLDPTTLGKLANQQAALADALAEAGERRDAIEQYRSALDRCPNFHDVRHRLGLALREAGLPAQAAQEFRRVLELHPSMLDSQIQLGLTYYSLGRTPDAIQEWQAVAQRDPSRDDAKMYLRLVGAAPTRPGIADAAVASITAALTPEATSHPRPEPASTQWETRPVVTEPAAEPTSQSAPQSTPQSTPQSAAQETTPATLLGFDPVLEAGFDEGLAESLELDSEPGDELLEFLELDALERLEGRPMPAPDDLFKED